jgi:glucose/arabinose dehydrogenase
MKSDYIRFTVLALGLAAPFAAAQEKAPSPKPERASISEYYKIETIATPKGLSTECGGLAFMPDGRLVACFHRGEVYTYEPVKKTWKLFADGLHDPLGVVALSDKEIVVMQRPELTRITDTDGDGVADQFDTISDAFGMTGNYHEFAFGPLLARDGSMFVSLNVASNGAGIRHEVRGTLSNLSGPDARMFSAVPWRGWVVRIAPDGTLTPWALGFRSPNGLGFDAQENLFVPDNQGDWIGSSPLYLVEKGKFYGHPASLTWKEGTTTPPVKMPVTELAAMKTPATIVFPHNLMANSPTQPLLIKSGGKFGPFEGQMIIGEMNRARIIRLLFDKVDGQLQGAAVPLIDNGGLLKGNNRLAFAKDGSLWVGQTDHGWAGDKGLQRITWTGKVPLDVTKMTLTKKGFDLNFTRALDVATASTPTAYKAKSYYYEYHSAYGSKQFDLQEITVSGATLSKDRKTVSLELPELTAWRIYELHLDDLKAEDGTPIANPLVCYTLNHLLENTPPPPPPGVSAKANGE